MNYFHDVPDRIDCLTKYSKLKDLALPYEEALGEKGTFQNGEEAMEFYLSSLSEMGQIAANEIAPTAADNDREGAVYDNGKVRLPEKLEANLKKLADFGSFAAPISKKYGGLNLPRAVQLIVLDMLGQACPNTALTVCAFSMGDFLQRFGTEEQKHRFLPRLMKNELTTAMALTEPQAGSDLGALRTHARKEGPEYVVNGSKLFITNGNADLIFALVRTDPQSTGLKGLSVILLEREYQGRENVRVTKIEDKICLHASPTCELLFENSVGTLIGEEGHGFKVMLELMNDARVAVSALALGICQRALEEAKAYAATRVTMGKPVIQHPMIADRVFEMETEIRALRSMIIEAAMAYDWMVVAEKTGDTATFKRWRKRYRRLTPLIKYACAEKCVLITRQALQIFGGYGVCRDYPVERLLRESLIFPIYEGTSQIQSLMVLKDTLKDVAQQATGFLGSLAGAWAESLVTRDPVKAKLLEARNELNQAIRTILLSIIKDKFKADIDALKQQNIQNFLKDFSLALLSEKTDLSFPFLCAERLTRITADYYQLKCMADHYSPSNLDHQKQILSFASIAIPRMKLENHYISNRLPFTLEQLREAKAS